jgi:penicillin-binding protein 1A
VKFNVTQGALVAMTPEGAVRAMVGGRNYADSQYNRAVTAKRQPGSAFKPFVFLTAIEGGLTPETIRQDAPLDLKGWKPENYTHEYFGAVTLTQALAMSLNTVAVRVGLEVGPKNVVRTAHRLGISSKLEANPSIALGTSEVSVIELVGAYAPFANGGLGVSPHVVTKIRTNEGKLLYVRQPDQLSQVIEPRHVAMMNTMMQETLLSGTARKAEIPGWMAAGKTGTSQDFRDAWFIGYTANLVTGVWLGNDDNSPTKKATGGGLPVEVWTRFMRTAHQGVPVASLPNSQRGGFMSNLFQTASQVSAAPSPSALSHRAADIGRRRQEPRRRHPIHRRGPEAAAGLDGWLWIGCSDDKSQLRALADQRRPLAGKDDPRFHRNAPVQILDVVVHEPDASGRDQMADGLG